MSRAIRSGMLFVAIVGAFASSVLARVEASARQSLGRVTISGTVLDSETGQPISGALVEAGGLAVFTNDQGAFDFEDLPLTPPDITAEKPGYVGEDGSSRSHASSSSARGVTVALGIVIKLMPEGIIFGQVMSAEGEPLEGIPVRLEQSAVNDGFTVWVQRTQRRTDDEGRFRIATLPPGTYYVLAGPGTISTGSTSVGAGFTTDAEAYAAVFYAAGSDLNSATPIQVGPGKQVEVDFALARLRLYHISGKVAGFNSGEHAWARLRALSGDLFGESVRSAPVDNRTGTFQSIAVPPGRYSVHAYAENSAMPDASETREAVVTVDIDKDLSDMNLTLGPARDIPIGCHVDAERFQLTPSYVGYDMTAAACMNMIRFLPADGTAVLDQRNPRQPRIIAVGKSENRRMVLRASELGRYSLDVRVNSSLYVESVTYDGHDLLREDLEIGEVRPNGTMRIEIRGDAGRLNGTVRLSAGVSKVSIFAVNVDRPKLIQRVFASQDGRFSFSALAPGSYKVFALENAENLAFREPGVLNSFASQASDVRINSGRQASIALTLISGNL